MSIFNRSLITDHNQEGFDSVDSLDFDYGKGCAVRQSYSIPGPPDLPPLNWTAADQFNYEELRRSDDEKEWMQDEYLKRKGII